MDGLWRRFGVDRRQQRARAALDERRLDEARRLYRELVAEPTAPAWVWFNHGLVHKLLHDWEPARDAFLRVIELDPGQFEGTFNLGVVATGCRDWATARRAWRDLKFIEDEGAGPPESNFGVGPVRLNATEDGGGEVVWGLRIDPCRMRLLSVPTPESGHRWGDIVLHDVVPRGQRMRDGEPVAVFDELERMDPSPFPTWQAELRWRDPGDAASLTELLGDRDLGGENWSESLVPLCATCSLAAAHVHEGEREGEVRLTGRWGFAGTRAAVDSALATWKAGGPGREATDLEEVG